MGARGNSGVILSQIVRGAAEELASRPGELVDPLLVAAAFASAADAAYDSVREPAEGTMLTVFREMAHSLTRQLAHLEADKQRLGRDVSEEQQDAILAEVLERAIADGERAVARTPEQLDGAARIGRRRRRRPRPGPDPGRGRRRPARRRRGAAGGPPPRAAAADPAPPRGQPLPLLHQLHRLRQRRSTTAAFLPRLEALGDSVLVVGDEATLKVHVHTDDAGGGDGALRGTPARSTNLDVADMREQIAERDARLATPSGRTGVVAVAAGEGLERLFAELGADVVPGGETLNPSTSSCWPGSTASPAEEVLVLPSSSNVIMAAERACELSEKPARVVPADLPAGEPAGAGRARPGGGARRERRAARRGAGGVATGGVAPAARDDAQGRFKRGDAVGFADGEIVAWGGAGSTLTGDDRAPRRGTPRSSP